MIIDKIHAVLTKEEAVPGFNVYSSIRIQAFNPRQQGPLTKYVPSLLSVCLSLGIQTDFRTGKAMVLGLKR